MDEEQLRLLAQTLFNALTEGSTYALIAVGYTMVYGIVRLVNFAHGEVFMVGAVVAHWLFTAGQVPFWLTLFLAMACCALLGWGLDRVAYRPLRRSTRLAALITAIGMSLILQTVVQLALGPNPRAFPETGVAIVRTADAPGRADASVNAEVRAKLRLGAKPSLQEVKDEWVGVSWNTGREVERVWVAREHVELAQGLPSWFNANLFGEAAPGEQRVRLLLKDVIIWVSAAALMIGLHFLVQKTRMGRAMRACAQDQTTAALMGVNVDRVIAFTFMIGSTLAAVAGVLYAVRAGGNISFRMGYYPGVIAFAAAVLGGIGEIKGAVLGGMLLGVARAFWAQYLPPEYDFAFCFSLMILVIIFRPYGLLGRAGATRA